MELKDLKKNMYIRHKYTPDDVVLQVIKIIKATPSRVDVIVFWPSESLEQEMSFTPETIKSWNISS